MADNRAGKETPVRRQALLGSMDLFRRVATETADHLTYPYPQDLDNQVSAYINQLFEGANR